MFALSLHVGFLDVLSMIDWFMSGQCCWSCGADDRKALNSEPCIACQAINGVVSRVAWCRAIGGSSPKSKIEFVRGQNPTRRVFLVQNRPFLSLRRR